MTLPSFLTSVTVADNSVYEVNYPPQPAPRYRFAWDDEISSYHYQSRTQMDGWGDKPNNPPAVLRFYPSMAESGDYRVNLTRDPSWQWRDTIIGLNNSDGEGERRFDYWTDPNTAQFNTRGWPQMAYLGMCGNEIHVLERAGEWLRFETLRPTDWLRARSMSIETHPCLIHGFSCVSWDATTRTTVRINSTGTPRGTVVYPVVTNEGSAWIPERFVVKL